MTDDEIHSELVRWIFARTKVRTIKDFQGGDRPELPYNSVALTRVQSVQEWQQDNQWTEQSTINSAGKNDLILTPLLEQEWEFSVSSYGDGASSRLRLISSLALDPQLSFPLFTEHHIHNVGQINYLPELINEQWEKRAQCYLTLRGVTTDGDIADTIEEIEDTIFAPV